jgi:GGDEF domain-containing protein
VRLRASQRASDVVASIGQDSFVVLLAFIDSPADGERVAAKLAQALRQPFAVAGRETALAIDVGLALYPDQGRTADTLLRRAVGQASSLATDAALGEPALLSTAQPAANDGG